MDRSGLAALAVLLLLPGPVTAQWPQFHADALHTGAAWQAFSAVPERWWSADLGSPIEASPVVADGRVFVGTLAGTLHAFDAVVGRQLWSFNASSPIVGSPAVGGGVVYLVTSAGKLFALDAATGELRLRAGKGDPDPGPSLNSPALHEGRLYVTTEAGAIIAYNLQTLTKDWEHLASQEREGHLVTAATNTTAAVYGCRDRGWVAKPLRSSPMVAFNKVFAGGDMHFLFALDEFGLGGADAGKTRGAWAQNSTTGGLACRQSLMPELGDVVRASPAADLRNQLVIVASYDNTVRAYQALDGAEKWRYTLSYGGRDARVIATPAVVDGRAYVAALNGRLYALETTTTAPFVREAWNFTAGEALWSSPAVVDGKVLFGGDDETLYMLNASDGKELWRVRLGGDLRAGPAVSGGVVYAASMDGTLHAYGGAKPALAELVLAGIGMPANVTNGTEALVAVHVENHGTVAAPGTQATLRIGNESWSQSVPPLQPGERTTLTFAWTPGPGEHTLSASVDEARAVREFDVANNQRSTLARAEEPASDPVAAEMDAQLAAILEQEAAEEAAAEAEESPPAPAGGFDPLLLAIPGAIVAVGVGLFIARKKGLLPQLQYIPRK